MFRFVAGKLIGNTVISIQRAKLLKKSKYANDNYKI